MYRTLLCKGNRIFSVLLISMLFLGCNDNDKVADEIAKIEVELKISRFDKEFAKAKPLDIPILKKTYPYLFPTQYNDSIWVAKLKDSIQVELFSEVGHTFPDFEDERAELELFFEHVKYYYPNYKIPKIVTVTSEVDYNNRIILTDSLLLIGLDNYLGPEHEFYRDIAKYTSAALDKQYIVSDVASTFAKKVVPRPKNRTFLSQMVYFGKELYLKDKLIPFVTDAQKINYSNEQLTWAKINESSIWRNFIEEEHLYSTDNKLGRRFLEPAPFSKFGLELDNESPGRIGRYIGWQIVRAFMNQNEVTLQQMLNLPAEEIFKKSNFKPKK